ncbi:MAG: peptidylprolyl isomerase [Bacteroidetes bacterium]|nr:peptidylprolyl isomerase [Bacteroidota bacterium]
MTAIAKDKVVRINYTLRNDQNMVVDSTDGREPLAYIQGNGHLISGLESQLEGKVSGDKLKTSIAPADAYGEKEDSLLVNVSKEGFRGDQEPQVGMQVQVTTDQGERLAHIDSINGDVVVLDMNHPLAGETLHFEVEVIEVRDATAEELDHGHVHGPGGHHH